MAQGGLDEASSDKNQQNVGNGVVVAMPSVKVTIVPVLLSRHEKVEKTNIPGLPKTRMK